MKMTVKVDSNISELAALIQKAEQQAKELMETLRQINDFKIKFNAKPIEPAATTEPPNPAA